MRYEFLCWLTDYFRNWLGLLADRNYRLFRNMDKQWSILYHQSFIIRVIAKISTRILGCVHFGQVDHGLSYAAGRIFGIDNLSRLAINVQLSNFIECLLFDSHSLGVSCHSAMDDEHVLSAINLAVEGVDIVVRNSKFLFSYSDKMAFNKHKKGNLPYCFDGWIIFMAVESAKTS